MSLHTDARATCFYNPILLKSHEPTIGPKSPMNQFLEETVLRLFASEVFPVRDRCAAHTHPAAGALASKAGR